MQSQAEEAADERTISVFTLNCWGLRCLSSWRKERIEAIGQFLSQSTYDIVLLQEVWVKDDFDHICSTVKQVLPYSHLFRHGIIGSGMGVITKEPIKDATFHDFSINGHPTNLHHGDWYAAKGLGICRVDLGDFVVHTFVSHYHAEYNPRNDVYLGHRVIQALESSQLIDLMSGADLTIYGGDLNTEPNSLPYQILRSVASLSDAWLQNGDLDLEGGETNQTPYNSFTKVPRGQAPFDGNRIDYLMFRTGPGVRMVEVSCHLPLPHRIPTRDCSYSDHEAVAAVFRLRRTTDWTHTAAATQDNSPQRMLIFRQALQVLDRSLVNTGACRYVFYSVLLLVGLFLSYLPSILLDPKYHLVLDAGLLIPRCLLITFLLINLLMLAFFNRREKNALKEARMQLQLIMNQIGRA